MKPIGICVFAILAALFLQGCATVEITPLGAMDGMSVGGVDGKNLRHVYISNGGYYLLDGWPLAMGDIRWDEKKQDIRGGTTFFREQGQLHDIEEVLVKIAERENCDLIEVTSLDESSLNAIDVTSPVTWFTWIFTYVETTYCGVLVPRDSAPSADEKTADDPASQKVGKPAEESMPTDVGPTVGTNDSAPEAGKEISE